MLVVLCEKWTWDGIFMVTWGVGCVGLNFDSIVW